MTMSESLLLNNVDPHADGKQQDHRQGAGKSSSHSSTQPAPGLRSSASLKTIALASIANLIFKQDAPQPTSAEEQLLYDVYQSLPHQTQQLLPFLENAVLFPGDEDMSVINLAQHYQLHWLEVLALALCLAVERDAMIGRAIAYVQSPIGTSRPSLGLLETAWASLSVNGSEIYHTGATISSALLSGKAVEIGLLQTSNSLMPIPEQALQIPQAVVMALQGGWLPLKDISITNLQDTMLLPESIQQQAKRHALTLGKSSRRSLIIQSTSTQEASAIVDIIASHLGKTPVHIRSGETSVDPIGILCVIANLLPVIYIPLQMGDAKRLQELTGYDGPIVVVTEPDSAITSESYSVMNWLVPIPKSIERQHLWQHYLSNQELASLLATDHMHSAGRIAELADISKREAELNLREQQTIEDIHRAAWFRGNDQLTALAEAIPGRIGDDALILSPSTHVDLDMLLHRCCNRESLVDNLGVSLVARYQPGVRSLFIGPSGTGKTLAAAWLASKLAMPLYRVDLASVISKYIGETEKNLASLMAKAERSDVILLFDEADSLFGKRTEIKDANDRYANTQTNYLLQRIENYQGIVLLTSNNRSRFDSAFTRRIDLIIDFPAPGPQERRALWYSHLGMQHNISAAQINQLSATLDICGGHIRNVVLAAAVLAHTEQRELCYDDLIQGLKIEYKKLAKKLPVELTKGS